MALPNPTTVVSIAGSTLALTDIASSVQILTRLVPAAIFKSLDIQYLANVNIPASSSISLSPQPPVVSFAVVYVRNAGAGNVTVTFSATLWINLDPGAVISYISPLLGATVISALAPGVLTMTVSTGLVASNVEVLAAG